MKLDDALKWFHENENNHELDTNKSDICPITKQCIKHKITLFCGHNFEYYALYEETKHIRTMHKCPYCRRVYPNYIPFYDIDEMSDVKNKERISCKFKNDYITCSHIFKSGKNKGNCCNKMGHDFGGKYYCMAHKKYALRKDKI